jgi:D-alanine transaminase
MEGGALYAIGAGRARGGGVALPHAVGLSASAATVLVDGSPADGIPADDPAVWRGHAVFETLRTYGGRPYRLPQHLERLAASAAWCDVPCPVDRLEREVEAVARCESQVNILLSPLHRVVRSIPLDLARVGRPISAVSSPRVGGLPGWVKHTNRLAWTMAAGAADEALFLADGHWLELTRSNLLIVRDGVARTPPDDGRILRGVTRSAVLEAARSAEIEVREEPVPAGPVQEMWAISTLKEMAPVATLDGVRMGDGPVGQAIYEAWKATFREAGA